MMIESIDSVKQKNQLKNRMNSVKKLRDDIKQKINENR